jgi:tripartite-type tricarboxylate transporter receptor subunit TctC
LTLPRRRFLQLAAGAAATPALSRYARAQSYPSRPVRIVVGFPAGGALDIVARLMGQWLSERLGQPFVIENRPGAGGNLATEAVVRAPADGYTLLQANSGNAWNVALYDRLNFDFVRDIAPIASIARASGIMEVHPSFPARTVPEFIAYAKANPGKLNMASSGVGSPQQVYGELFKMMTGVEMVHVPFRGTPAALTALFGGEVHVYFDALATSIEHVRSGRLRALGVTVASRLDVLPDIPTVGEFVPGYEASAWQGVGAPKNTPSDIIERLNKEINEALADPRIKARLVDLGYMVFASSPAEFGAFVAEYTEKWGKVIRTANIKAE